MNEIQISDVNSILILGVWIIIVTGIFNYFLLKYLISSITIIHLRTRNYVKQILGTNKENNNV